MYETYSLFFSLRFSIFVGMRTVLNKAAGILLVLVLFLAGCENDIERINMLTDESEAPTIQGTNIRVIYSDSAKVKVQVIAPAYKQFPNAERPYMEFEDGLQVYFYNDSAKIESEIAAAHQELKDIQGEHALLREEVEEDDIAHLVAQWTGIPAQRLVEEQG